jgi:hypothetical protein
MSPQDSPPPTEGRPFAVEYYYKARWGFAEEFLALFRKNHWPVLRRQVEAGRLLRVTAVRHHLVPDFWGLGLATELAREMEKARFRYERDVEYAGVPLIHYRLRREDWEAALPFTRPRAEVPGPPAPAEGAG